jgi:hypothetical protein
MVNDFSGFIDELKDMNRLLDEVTPELYKECPDENKKKEIQDLHTNIKSRIDNIMKMVNVVPNDKR